MGSQALPANLLRCGLLSPQVLLGACSSVGSTWNHRLLWAHPPAPAWGASWATGGYLLHCGPVWAAGISLPHHGLLYGLQGVSGACPPPPSSLTLVSAELLLSHSLTPLSGCNCCCAGFFSPLLKYVIPEVLPLQNHTESQNVRGWKGPLWVI